VPDNEVEFDHIIPYSRGGTTTPHNLRLVHRNCNRSKGASLKDLLEDPAALLREMQQELEKAKQG
jgi:5-methylcytosine-specific restriction endonuclease McrA